MMESKGFIPGDRHRSKGVAADVSQINPRTVNSLPVAFANTRKNIDLDVYRHHVRGRVSSNASSSRYAKCSGKRILERRWMA